MDHPASIYAQNKLPMSSQAFADWGSGAFAYLKPENNEGVSGYAIYGANGRHLAFVENQETAKALVLQNELMPVSVH